MLHITEDTPADMLAGSMELIIHLPTGKTVKMFVERSTPMMDMLVQITTNNQLQITNYILQPLQTSSNPDQPEKILTYYPNTPIGTLDTQHIRVVSKTRTLPVPKNIPPGHQPFESTFRLKVHLPRNQLYVTRVSRHVLIEDIMRKVCEEKDLDPNKYEVRHPGNLNEVLDPKLTLNDYMITEIHIVMKNSNPNQMISSNDIMTLKKDNERKQLQSKSGGVFNLIFKKNKSNNGSGPFSAAINSIFTTRKDNKSSTQAAVPVRTNLNSKPKTEIPKPPQRKRRPAPKPPQIVEKIESPEEPVEMRVKPVVNSNEEKNETNLMICHSRHSSDSSGYHETSFLSDQCNTSLPRMSRLKEGKISKTDRRHSDNFGNDMATTARSRSTPSLVFPGRKKKAAPSPPVTTQKSMNSPNLEKPSPVVASLTSVGFFPSRSEFSSRSKESSPEIYATIDRTTKINAKTTNAESIIETEEEFINEECTDYEKCPADSGNSSDISEKSKMDERVIDEEIVDVPQISDDGWQPPSPPKAFKDSAVNQNMHTEIAQTNSVIDVELIRKLKAIEGEQNAKSELNNRNNDAICVDPPIYNKLSLENLEKRRSLVYNRELATSLKSTCRSNSFLEETNNLSKKFQSDLDLSGKSNEFDKMLEDIRRQNIQNEKNKSSLTQSTLPNFKITTYDEPKQNVKVFEDDTIRSNSQTSNLNKAQSLQRIYIPNSTENIAELCQNNTEYLFKKGRNSRNHDYPRRSVNRSESFSSDQNGWGISKPVTRSKSQVGIKKIDDTGSLSKSSSLFDISGLQSLGVMKKIQDKLNTPTASMETLDATEEEIKNIRQKIQDVKSSKNRYSYPASINIGTWSERPKIPVNIQEDVTQNSSEDHFETSLNLNQKDSHNNETATIKLESTNITTQKNGNVLIKIGNEDFNEPKRSTLPSDFDVSRVPVVRAVELKKTLKDNDSKSKFYDVENDSSIPIFRKKSFLQFTSTLMNFKNSKTDDTIYGKSEKEKDYTTNQNVPFSKLNLRRTESKTREENRVENGDVKLKKIPSVQSKSNSLPPRMKSPRNVVDPREELLKSIRDFGGKKGLRSRKA